MSTPSFIRFTKMHGLGNDFVVINAINQEIVPNFLPIIHLADRHLGIGFDQLLVMEKKEGDDNFFCRIFNADGSEAEQCGNGLRCVARYIHEEKISSTHEFKIATKAGTFSVNIQSYEEISLSMGEPNIIKPLVDLQLGLYANTIAATVLSLGNPHVIVRVESLQNTPIHSLGPEISENPIFSSGANVGFMQILNDSHIVLRTFERGAGETYACGSNATAAAVAGIINGWLKSPVTIEYQYGNLQVKWDGAGHPIYLIGPAAKVFTGEFSL